MSPEVTVAVMGGAYLTPGFSLKVQVSPSLDTVGASLARSGKTSAPCWVVSCPL